MLRQLFTKIKFQIVAVAIFVCSISTNLMSAQETTLPTKQNASQTTIPVPVESVVFLAPSNSRISFVGTHVGDDPKPRLGGFANFYGQVKIDPSNSTITSIGIDIQVDSVWTEFAKLTAHLKNADFFRRGEVPRRKK